MKSKFDNTIRASIIYLIVSVIATIVAVDRNIPARVFGVASGKPVLQGFFEGYGTALTAPFHMLVILTILTLLLVTKWPKRKNAVVIGIMVYGCLSFLGSIFEQIVTEVFSINGFEPLLAMFIIILSATALLMVIFGYHELGNYKKVNLENIVKE